MPYFVPADDGHLFSGPSMTFKVAVEVASQQGVSGERVCQVTTEDVD